MSYFTSTIDKQKLSLKDKISLVICLFGLFYVGLNEPRIMTVFAFTSIATVSLLFREHPILAKRGK